MRNIRPIKCIIRVASLLAMFGLFALAGCQNPMQRPVVATEDGTLSLVIETQGRERAIMPTITMNDFSRIRLSFADSANPASPIYRDWDNAPVSLPAGTWDMRATAYLDDAATVEAARSALIPGIVVIPGQTATLTETVMLLPIPQGQGTFRWSIGFPASAVRAEMEVWKLDESLNEIGDDEPCWYYDDFDLTAAGLDGKLTGSAQLAAGTYRVFLTLANAQGETFTVRSALHVWHNMESVFEENFTSGIFPVELFAHVMRAWNGTAWNFADPEIGIEAGDFETLLDIRGVDDYNFSGIIHWLNVLTYNGEGTPIVPGDLYDFIALVDAALIGVGADADFRGEESHADREALEQAVRDFALNETPMWFYWPSDNKVIVHIGDYDGIYFSVEIALHERWRMPLTVTFYSAGGTLIPPVQVQYRDTVPEPEDDPTKIWAPTAGLWLYALPLDKTPVDFIAWYCEAGGFRWYFDDMKVTADTTLIARWDAPATRVETVPANNLTAAVNHINENPGTFTLAMSEDTSTPGSTLSAANSNLTIIGLDETWEIRAMTSRIITVGSDPAAGAGSAVSLTLGNNITLVGRAHSSHASMDLVRVRNHGRLYMETGSKITGHVNGGSTTTNGFGSAVNIEAHGTLTMRGGEITGNHAMNNGTDIGAGVSAAYETSRLYMKGGRIHGNTRGNVTVDGVNVPGNVPADIRINRGVVSLSQDAELYRVILVNHDYSSISIGADWDGKIHYLDLRGGGNNQASLNAAIANWTDSTVLRAAPSHILRTEDVANIASTRFIAGGEAWIQPITDTHEITVRDNAGVVRRILFNVTFDSAGGSSVPTQPVRENDLATAPAVNPIRASSAALVPETPASAGLWTMAYGFAGWQRRVGDTLQTWSFDTPIIEDIALVAQWNTTATPTLARVEAIEANDVTAAVAHVDRYPGRYTLAINAPAGSSGNQLTADGAHLTIIGLDGPQTITLTNNQRLFDIGATALVTGDGSASLTIGNDITLVGRDGNTVSLIRVRDNASLYMLSGSKIRGHIHSGTASRSGSGSAVHVEAYGMFTMSGGTITENRATGANATSTAAVGGVTLYNAAARFYMTGGSITGNFRGDGDDLPADVGLGNAVTNFTMSGDAALGHLNLNAAAATASVNIGAGGWEGRVDHLTLRWNSATLTTVINNWVTPPPAGRTVIRGTLTQDMIDRLGYTSARFIGSNDATTQDIADYHEIAIENGAGVVRAIPIPIFTVIFDSAGGTPVASQTVERGNPITPPADPTDGPAWDGTPATPGLWLMTQTFDEWRHNGAAWDFDNYLVTADMTLTAHWVAPTAPIAGVAANNVAAAMTHINVAANANLGAFTLAISQNVDSGAHALTDVNARLTIIGLGDVAREIRFTADVAFQRLFDVGPTANNPAAATSLTLGNNVTLVGRTLGQHGQEGNNSNEFVRVRNGGHLIMEASSRITGHTGTSATPGGAAAVHVYAGGTFTMSGGTITGNRVIHTWSDLASGVSVAGAETARFYMTGGSITGNTRGGDANNAPADVTLIGNPNALVLSGNASIGSVVLLYGSRITIITIGPNNWTGSITQTNLMTVGDLAATITSWEDSRILQAAPGSFLTDSHLAGIRPGIRFVAASSVIPPPHQPLAQAHRILLEPDALAAYIRR